ncbi:Oxysterol-binding protein-related protein 7 [Lonchura striata]|uniref:Oxysterol-binding protein n=1 Tax=Lonchura striata TaxID=40157 RepID=A0A218UCH3_9PASE|nr:Oxysterol-binding protein-related protein 7 [Lonchura striata domestica]
MGSHEKDPCSPKRALSRSSSTVSSKHSSVQQGSESWEVVEEPRARGSPGQQPQRHEGYLLKKRKWPLKGWHKRYFVLENGILKYSTTRQDVLKGKLHGAIDVRQSVMSVNKKAQRVDLDTEDNIYHLKGQWTRILPSGSAPALSTLASSRDKVNAWLKDSEGLERCSAELSECQAKLQELTGMLQHLEALHRIPSAPLISGSQPSAATERPKKGRRSTKIWCTQSFAKDDTIGRVGRLHGSVPNLSRYLESSQSQLPFSVPPEYSQLQRSFWVLAQKVHGSLSSVVAALVAERARLEEMRQALHRQGPAPRPGSAGTAGPALRRFHSLSASSDTTLDSFASLHPDEPDALPAKGREQQLSNRSIVSLADSHTEFFDACEVFLSASSSENELNEPLNTLQRLCEELEYSELLDRASRARDPRQRLVYVAAFAVSAYASTYYRAGSKPFNPVLGETYECVRPDRGFRFISEQVSHHPPISACHAESDNFVFWQDMRWKNKFWGKSLEIVPMGTVNVQLPRTGDHYEWNKVTTCIHNVLSGPRWIEHYGEVLIRNTRDASFHCKLTFCKMPRDHERNYGFTQFALELNELTPELRRVLPSTDTRLRPDQRYLEEGNVPAAEAQKRQIEQLQRDRRRVMEENNIAHQARFFRRVTDASGKESWVTNNTYWKLRLDPGFSHLDSAVLW